MRLCFWVGVPSQKQRMLLSFVPFCSIFRPVILLNRPAARNRYRAISLRPAMHQKCNFLGPCSCLIAKFSCFIRASRPFFIWSSTLLLGQREYLHFPHSNVVNEWAAGYGSFFSSVERRSSIPFLIAAAWVIFFFVQYFAILSAVAFSIRTVYFISFGCSAFGLPSFAVIALPPYVSTPFYIFDSQKVKYREGGIFSSSAFLYVSEKVWKKCINFALFLIYFCGTIQVPT